MPRFSAMQLHEARRHLREAHDEALLVYHARLPHSIAEREEELEQQLRQAAEALGFRLVAVEQAEAA